MYKRVLILSSYIFISVTIIAQTQYNAKKISFRVKRLSSKLSQFDKVTGERIGKSATVSEQYQIFQKITDHATENELYELTNHPNPIVRAYALTGLSYMNSSKTLDVLSKNKNDTAIIKEQFGCIGSHNTVIGYMLILTKNYIKKNNIQLTQEQKDLFDYIETTIENWRVRFRKTPSQSDE